ncbi:hypothetical protein B0H14DRAFT_3488507 [Mycena olivaceomarginata]|nr:hypothetical protein B0H14DRAFT_3488507 [Mycena olivaceomarginata]
MLHRYPRCGRFSIPARFHAPALSPSSPFLHLPPDLHVEVILMCIAQLQLSTAFPPTLGRHNRLVHPSRFLNINAFEWRPEERACILDTIRSRSGEMMHLFGHWAAQRCLEAATGPEERHAECRLPPSSSGRMVDLARNATDATSFRRRSTARGGPLRLADYLGAALERSGDDADYGALVNPTSATDLRVVRPTSSHRADSNPSSPRVNTPLGRAACHETGSLLVQRGFENFEESVKEGAGTSHHTVHSSISSTKIPILIIIDSPRTQGSRSALTTLKEGGKDALDCVVQRMFEPAEGYIHCIQTPP